jgi:hypothetical protein
MKLPAQRAKTLLEIRSIQTQFPRHTHERKIIRVTAEAQNLAALRTEMHVLRRAGAAIPADLKSASGCWGRHRQRKRLTVVAAAQTLKP